jgi:hypothetical protein
MSRVIELREAQENSPDGTRSLVHTCIHMYMFTIPCDFFKDALLHGQHPELKHLQLHRETTRIEVLLWSWDKNSLRENLHFLSHICKSSQRTRIRRDVVSDTYVTPSRILVFAVIGW